SGSGPRQAMEGALQSAKISAVEIDYINAHGTATPFNDAAEGKAIADLFDGVALSSTKGMMGHSLGAAGAIEAIISILALQNQFRVSSGVPTLCSACRPRRPCKRRPIRVCVDLAQFRDSLSSRGSRRWKTRT